MRGRTNAGAIGAHVGSATPMSATDNVLRRIMSSTGWVDQNKVPNILLVSEPSLSTQRIGGRCGR